MSEAEPTGKRESKTGRSVSARPRTEGAALFLGAEWSQSGLLEALSRLTRRSSEGLSLAVKLPGPGCLAVGPDSERLVELLAGLDGATREAASGAATGPAFRFRTLGPGDAAEADRLLQAGVASLESFGAPNDERGLSWLAYSTAAGFAPFRIEGEMRQLAAALATRLLLEERRGRVALLERFLASVAHELKGPLTALLGTLELELRLRSRGSSLDAAGLASVGETTTAGATLPPSPVLQRMLRELWRMNEMVQALLETALLRSGRFAVDRRPVKFDEWLARLLEDRLRPLAAEFNVALDSRSAGIPEYVWMDPLRMEELVTNLALFALRSSPGGEAVRLYWSVDGGGRKLQLVVEDSGAPLAPEDRARLFRPFEAPAPVLKRGALGLALYLAREIALVHHGSLTAEAVETPVGVAGNRLRLTIPCTPAGTDGREGTS